MELEPTIADMKKLVVHISKLDLDLEFVKNFLQVNNLIANSSVARTGSSPPVAKSFGSIIITNVKIEENVFESINKTSEHMLTADVMEMGKAKNKRKQRKPKTHRMVMKFRSNRQYFSSLRCENCGENAECTAIPLFVYLFQKKEKKELPEKDKENATPVGHTTKKRLIKRELCVVLQRLDLNKLPTVTETVKTSSPSPIPALQKVKKQAGPITSEQLEQANQLSMVQLIRDFKGNDAQEFLRFCGERMEKDVCDSIPLLTIEQAETKLWHELRIGRITASRIQEASRCGMLNGSLVQKIMGQSSGFTMAMKRGTDLEGHVLAELRKEYPGLRDTGLILDPVCPWMGASPDGICDEFVLEIKCPNTPNTYECYVDVTKLSKKYFSQIQLQMHMAHRTKALLAVAALDFEQTKAITKVWIEYDKQYVDDVMKDAYEFWCKAVFKALLRKRNGKK